MLDFEIIVICILFGMSIFMIGYGGSIGERGTQFIGIMMLLVSIGLALMAMSGTSTIFIPYLSDMLGSA